MTPYNNALALSTARCSRSTVIVKLWSEAEDAGLNFGQARLNGGHTADERQQ